MNILYEMLKDNGLEDGINKLSNERCDRLMNLFNLLCDSSRPYLVVMNFYTVNKDGKKFFRVILIDKSIISNENFRLLLSRITEQYSLDARWDLIYKSNIALYVKKNRPQSMNDSEFYKNFGISYHSTIIDSVEDYLNPSYNEADYIYQDTLEFRDMLAHNNISDFIIDYIMYGSSSLKNGSLEMHITRFVFYHNIWNKLLEFKHILLPPYPYSNNLLKDFIKAYDAKMSKIIMLDRILNIDINKILVLFFIKLILGKTKLPISLDVIKYRTTLLLESLKQLEPI